MNNELLISDILSKIHFKIKPHQNIRKEYFYRFKKKLYKFLKKEKLAINGNTNFKNVDKKDLDVIEKLSSIDTMSKIAIGFIINQISKSLPQEGLYLNIGVWRGFSMFAGMINTKCKVYGVDNFSFNYEEGDSSKNNYNEKSKTIKYFNEKFEKFQNINKHFFFDMDYKKFFKLLEKDKKLIDFYFYDGEHSYQNQFDNLIIAKDFFKKGTIILVDDYNEINVKNATLDFVSKYSSGFKIIKEIRTANKYIHPTFANGIILLEKIN